MKPYGRSFPELTASNDPALQNCIYHSSKKPGIAHLANRLLGLTAFSQANITSLQRGGVGLIICSLYPFEKGFVPIEDGTLIGKLKVGGEKLATGIGTARIKYVQDQNNGYFQDLLNEYKFLKALNGEIIKVGEKKVRYILLSNYGQLQEESNSDLITVYIGLSFEGMHSLYDTFSDIGRDNSVLRTSLALNLTEVKGWDHRPLFVTFAHHFYNGLCGHAASLTDFSVKLVTNQTFELGSGVNDLGKYMIGLLLSNTNGRRILIDIKHMSIAARNDYFDLLDSKYVLDEIPVVVSHGAVCGRSDAYDIFLNADINFSDAELVRIGRSRGLFGIQLDERRIANSHEISLFKKIVGKKRKLSYAALLVWRQIEYIAVLLDINQLPAWDIQCLGSDNDGIVNPLDGIWSSEDFPLLKECLLIHADNFVAKPTYKMDKPENLISGEKIVEKFMSGNMLKFLEINFN